MAKYFNKNGIEYNLEEIAAAAKTNNKSIEDVIADNELIMQEEEQDDIVGKEEGVVVTDPPTAPNKKSGSSSKNTSSASSGKKRVFPTTTPFGTDAIVDTFQKQKQDQKKEQERRDALEKQYQKEEQAQKEKEKKQNKYQGKERGAFLSNFRTDKERQETVDKNLEKILKKSPEKTTEEAFELLQKADSLDADISELIYGEYNLEDLTYKTPEARKISDIADKKNKAQKEVEQAAYRKDFEINNPDKIAPWAFEGDEEDVAVRLAPVLESLGLEAVSSGMGNEITVQILDYENPKFGTVNESFSFDLDEFKKNRVGFIEKFNKQINLMKDTQYVKKVKNRAQGSFNAFQKQFGLDEDKRGFDEIENEINKERLKEFKDLKTKFGALLPKGYFKGDDKKYTDYVHYISKGTLMDKDIEDIAFYKYKDKLFDGRTLEEEKKKYKEEVTEYSFPLAEKITSGNPFTEQENPFDGFKEKAIKTPEVIKEAKDPSVFELVEHRSKNKAKDLDGKIQDFVSFELSRNKSANKLGNILTSDLRILQREYEKGLIKNSKDLKNEETQYTTDAATFEKELKAFKKNSDKLLSQPVRTAADVDALKLTYLDLLSKQEKLDKARENLQIAGLSLTKEANLAPVALTNFSKNYDRLSELALGFKELGTKLAMGGVDLLKNANRTTPASVFSPEITKYSIDLLNNYEKEKQKLQTNLKVDEIRSVRDLGKWVAGSTAQTLPSLAMAFTGELALPLFFLSGYGEATSKIELEKQDVLEKITKAKNQILLLDPVKDQAKIQELNNAIEQERSKINMDEGSEMAYKLLYGTSEAAFELVTLGTLKSLKLGIKQLPKQAIRDGFTGILKEGGSEFATTVSQNFGDIYIKGDESKSLFEGGLESFAQGGLMGLGFSSAAGVGVLKRAVASELATRKDILQSKELVKRIVDLTGNKSFMLDQNISIDQLTENLHPKVKEEVISLVNQVAEVDNNILDRLNYEYSADNLLDVGKINARIRQINKSVQEISADPTLSLAQVTELKKSYEKDFNELNEKRQEILSKGDGDIKTELAKQFNFSALEFYNDRVLLERNKVYFSLLREFDGLNEDEKADYELKAMAIQENDNNKNLLYTGEKAPNAATLYVQDKVKEVLNKKRKIIEKFIDEQGIKDEIDIVTFDVTENENLTQLIDRATALYAEKNGLSNNDADVLKFKKDLKMGYVDGVILGDNKTIIEFVPNAAKNGRVSVLAHEIGHHEITKVFGNEKTGEAFLKFIEKNYPSSYIKVKARLDKNENFIEGTETLKPDATQEPFTYFIDTLADNNAVPNKKVLAQIASFLDSKQKVISFTNMLGQNDAAMFNYLIDFTNKTYFNKGGKMPSKNYIVGTDQERDTPNVTRASRSIDERMDKLDLQLSNNEIDFEKYETEMKKLEQEEFEQSKKTYEEEKKVVRKETTKKESTKREPSEISEAATKAKAKLDAIGNDPKGFNPNNPAIYDELDKMVKVKSRNYKTSNGTIIDLTNKNKGGLDGFSMEEMTSYVTVSMLPYIQKFDPSKNDSLYGYINAQLANRMKAALKSGQVADVVFTEDVSEMTKLSNEEVEVKSISLPERKRFQNILESGVFSPDVIESVQAKMAPLIRTLESKFNEKTTLNKTVSPLIREIKNYIGTQADIDIKKAMGGKEDQVLQNWLITNKKTVLENLPTTWLMGKDNGKTVSGGMPFAIQKQVNGRWLNYPDWIGKKVDRESVSTDLAGRTSGHELVRRLPEVNKNVSVEEFLSAIIDLKNGDVIRGRKESLAKVMSEELTLDILIDDFLNDGPLFQLFVKNQEAKGILRDDIIVNDIVRQSERGNVKFSLTKTDIDMLSLNSAVFVERLSEVNDINKDSIKQVLIDINWDDDRIDAVASALWRPIGVARKFFEKEEVNKNVEKILNNFGNVKDYGERMYQLFDTKKRVTTFFRNKKNVDILKRNNIWFGRNVIEKYGQEKGLQLLKAFWGDTILKKDGVGLFNNKKEFNDYLIQVQEKLQSSKKPKSKKATINEVVNPNDISNKFVRSNAVYKNYFDGSYDVSKDKFKTDAAQDFLIFTAEWWMDRMKKKDPIFPASVFTMMLKSREGIIRTAAPVIGLVKDGEFKSGAYVFEHDPPARNIASLLVKKTYLKDDSISYGDIFDDYNAIIVPEKLSTALDASGVKDMASPFQFFPKSKDGKLLRYEGAKVKKLYGSINGVIQFFVENKINTTNEKALTNNLSQSKKSMSISTVSDFINANNLKRIDAETSFDILNDLNKEIENYWGIVPNDIIVKMGRAVDYAFDVIEDRENEGGPLMAAVNDALNLETIKFAEKQLNEFVENNRPKDQKTISKFSLTSKRDLKWETNFGVASTDFKVGKYTYTMYMSSVKEYGLQEDPLYNKVFKNIANDLELPFNYLVDNKNIQWFSFEEKKLGSNILNTGNAFEVLGIVTNALADYANKNNLEGIAFEAKEPSRIRLYNTLANTIGSKLGWTYNTENLNNEDKAVVFLLTPAKNNTKSTMYSKTLDFEFNDILERNTGVAAFTKVSDVVAKRTGIKKNTLSFFVPPSADDFRGLTTYMFAGKGKQGEQDQEFFDKNLVVPYVKGVNTLDSVRQSIRKEYKMLLDNFPDIKKKLEKLTPDKGFTYDQAVRVYLWSSTGKEVPGLSRTDKNKLLYFVKQNPDLLAFANALSITGRQDGGWIDPSTTWDSETIISDLHNITEGAGRKKYLEEFIENADAIFTKENLNKIQSIYGTNTREALEDSLYRMKNGKNRPEGTDRVTNTWMNWINGSTAAIMFFNTRSALLQTISAINFLNWNDNNPYMAGKAFLNQKQYWADFAMIINSDKLKERRSGLKADVTQAEIANAANSAKNKFNGVISYLQKIGFTPTQAADSFSIAVSGATFYRNRVNTYLKAGNTVQEAEEKAFNDFSIITDQSMQSADPMYVSKQQTTALGRIILAFGNTPMQYNRLIKKATLDLANRRGDWRTNVSKIVYYGALQNILFSALQSALFIPLGYGDDEEEPDTSKMTKEEKKAYEKLKKKQEDKITNMINGMADTLLRGSGVYGAAIATIKNTAMEYFKQEEKEMFADHAYTVLALTSVSPPISSKARKLYGAIRISKFEKDVITERGWEVTRDGKLNLAPNYRILGNVTVATTNLPLDRIVEKVNNISEVIDSRNSKTQRAALALGWKDWELNVKNEENETIKETAKAKRKEEGVEKAIETRKANKANKEAKFNALSPYEKRAYLIKEEKENDKKYREKELKERRKRRKMG